MRGPTAYETYLHRMRDYYKIKHLEEPEWIEKASLYYNRLFYAQKDMGGICKSTNISKKEMEWLGSLKHESLEGLPDELKSETSVNDCLIAMYEELMAGKDEYFVHEWTLSKKGRHKMREYVDAMPSVRYIEPPKNEFTNVPDLIVFSNGIWWWKAEYNLVISLAGSFISISSEGSRERRFTFTEHFLDAVIPIVQQERIEPYLTEMDRNEDRNLKYQDFKIVLVSVGWKDYELSLADANTDNPFIELLRLVKKEYSKSIEEKKLIVPWLRLLD